MKKLVLILTAILTVASLSSQEMENEKVDYTSYYRTPFTLGFSYANFSPITGFNLGSPYNIVDLNLNMQYTMKSIPTLQPELILGYGISDSQNSYNAELWDSSNIYALGGIKFNHRFSKSFEAGIELASGYSQTKFTGLAENSQVLTNFLMAQGSIYFGLNPNYNLNLKLSPTVRYQYCMDSFFKDRNGFLVGIGGIISFNFGSDPDLSSGSMNCIQFKDLKIDPLFAAMQSYYRENPFGSITLKNIEKRGIENLVVSFFQPRYMDAPSIISKIPLLRSDESAFIDLTASFNQEIFLTEGITPLNGEISVSYKYNNQPMNQSYSVSYDLYDKSSIIWDDDRKIAAFITSADSALQNYTSFIRQSCKEAEISGLNIILQQGIELYNGLTEIGCIYQADPLQPFATLQNEKVLSIDTVSLPRNTLKKLTGDCDDLTALYLSLLETLGIETAFITVPGHIYTAFNTKADANSYQKIHPDREMTINIDGELWIPVEITLIGRSSFSEAWKNGAEEWQSYSEKTELRKMFLTNQAKEIYRPVGLLETDLGLQYGNGDLIAASFSTDLKNISDLILNGFYNKAKERNTKQDYNKLGVILSEFGRIDEAADAFNKALKMDKDYLSPYINLGNISYLSGDYQKSVRIFSEIITILEGQNKGNSSLSAIVNLNLSKTFYALKEYEVAKDHYTLAFSISPDRAKSSSYLGSVNDSSGLTRASEALENKIIFIDIED